MKSIGKLISFIAIAFTLLFFSCNDDNSSNIMRIHLTDAPFPVESVDQVNVTFERIEARLMNASGDPFVVLTNETQTFNLLDLTNGITATLVEIEVPAGTYDLVSVVITDAEIIMKNETVFDMTVPSGAQSGLKIFLDPPIDVVGGLSAELLLDFNVDKSFVPIGNENTPPGITDFNFNPVIRAANLSTAGRIEGIILDNSQVPVNGVTVTVNQNNEEVTSTLSTEDDTGQYAVIGLEAGTYSLTFNKEGYEEVTVEVEVVAGNRTTQDIELIPTP